MPKSAVVLLLIYSLLTMSLSSPARAQSETHPKETGSARIPVKPAELPAAGTEDGLDKKKIDFQSVIDAETKRFNADSGKFDPAKFELAKAKQAQKRGWSKKDTALMVLLAVGITVLVVVLVKYGKECAETNPPNCSLGSDEFCLCERYEQETERRGMPAR